MILSRVLLGLAAAGLMVSAAHAADLAATPAAAAPAFSFDGFYAGVYAGGATAAGGWGTVGAMVGANKTLTPGVLGGIELQGGGDWMSGGSSYDVDLLLHLGFTLTDSLMLYGAVGVGITDPIGPVASETGYLLGAGIEVGVTDSLSLRGEALYGHAFSGSDDAGKATVGLIWHMK